MKKVVLSLILGIMLIGVIGFVVAEDNGTVVCDTDNLDLCLDDLNCTTVGGVWENETCVEIVVDNETEDENETDSDEDNFGLGQYVRRRVKAGVYTSPEGQQIRVRELAQNRIEFFNGNYTIQSELNLTQEQDQNQTKLKVKLNNGRNVEIKIMPNVASEKALARLRLKSCNDSENCSIELKEVGEGNQTRLVYEAKAQKTFRVFGFIKNREEVMTQIDAETGEEIKGRRPWWAWMASEEDEAEEIEAE